MSKFPAPLALLDRPDLLDPLDPLETLEPPDKEPIPDLLDLPEMPDRMDTPELLEALASLEKTEPLDPRVCFPTTNFYNNGNIQALATTAHLPGQLPAIRQFAQHITTCANKG